MPIFIDNRGSGERELAELLKKKQLAVKVKHLDSGDIVFGEVGIERKTVNDLISSIVGKNKRFWDQLKVLKNTYKYPLVIVEGQVNYKDKWISGVLASIAIGWKVPYINTFNLQDSAYMIKNFFMKYGPAKSSTTYLPKAVKKAITPKEIRWAMLQCLPRIGPEVSKRILESYTFTSLRLIKPSVVAKRVKGLSEEKAELLQVVLKDE